MSTAEEHAQRVEDYLRTVIAPLLDDGSESLVMDRGGGFQEDYMFRVRVPADQFGHVLGRGGANADAIRRLARARSRALGWHVRLDVRIVAL